MMQVQNGEVAVIVDIVCAAWREAGSGLEGVAGAAARAPVHRAAHPQKSAYTSKLINQSRGIGRVESSKRHQI